MLVLLWRPIYVLPWRPLEQEDALPEDELLATEEAARCADVAMCLGTSLQITPACNLPLLTSSAGALSTSFAHAVCCSYGQMV